MINDTGPTPPIPPMDFNNQEVRCLNTLLNKYLNTASESEPNRDAILKTAFESQIPLKERIAIVQYALDHCKKEKWRTIVNTIKSVYENCFPSLKRSASSIDFTQLFKTQPPIEFIATLNEQDAIDPKIEPLETSAYQDLLNKAEDYSIPSIAPVRGIVNQGNTCFLITAFQLIMNHPRLLEALTSTYESLPETDINKSAYNAFLQAVKDYNNKKPVDLTLLRTLFTDPWTSEPTGMGDADEVINTLLAPVDQAKYPDLFFTVREEKTFTLSSEQDDEKIDTAQAYDVSLPDSTRTTIPIEGILTQEVKNCTFIVNLASSIETSGQKLLEQQFEPAVKIEDPTESAVCKTPDGEYKMFYPSAERLVLKTAPEQFMMKLNRLTFDLTGNQRIINTEITMPETILLPLEDGSKQSYQLKSIAVHTGGVHYYSLIKRDDWYLANDAYVMAASKETLDRALTGGYIYYYEKASSNQ